MDLLSKIDGLAPGQIAFKLFNWGKSQTRTFLGEMWANSGGLELKAADLMPLVRHAPLDPSEAVEAVINSVYRFSPPDEVFDIARDRFPGKIKDLIIDADNLVGQQFHILGIECDYSDEIRWHYDPANDHQFPRTQYFSRIPHTSPVGGFDIKYPWELSRLQHFPRLALAFRLTGDSKYKKALIKQTGDWLRNNPVAYGPNWACTMDVAIRAANLSFAFAILKDSHLDTDFKSSLAIALVAHGRFILANLEWSDTLTANHYLADIAGLAVLASHLSGAVPEADAWLEFCRNELIDELDKQVYPDGCDFEASTAYHRLVLELFIFPAIFMSRSGISFDDRFYGRLGAMAEFLRDISLPSGDFPLIGDNDSGLFMALECGHLSDVRYLLALASTYLSNKNIITPELNADPDILWLLDHEGLEKFDNLKNNTGSEFPTSSKYPDGGLFCLYSENRNDLVTFRLGPVGQNGFGGHAHNDQLSVTVCFDESPVIVDPGSAVYTSDPEKRNIYRSTRAHATIALGEDEQNPFTPGDLFKLRQSVKTEFRGLSHADDNSTVSGSLLGYGNFSQTDVRMKRTVTMNRSRRQVEIRDDVVLGNKARNLKPEWVFPLGPGLLIEDRGPGYLKIIGIDGRQVAEILYLPGWRLTVLETSCSPAYGVEVPNQTLQFTPPDGTNHAEFIIRATSSTV